ncbi:MAG: hypothetical protein J6T94_11450 [Bacteroidaceae bacterium]|nr:hypothetical protein [Bacteroidaceae bacterium]
MEDFSRAGYVRREKNYEEGKKIFGEHISRAEERKNLFEERIILFTQRSLLNG